MKVLCPLDGSKRSTDAARKALNMLPDDADVTLLCVQSEGFEDAPEDVVEMFDDDEDDEVFPTQDSAQRMLDEVAADCGRSVVTKVVKGNVRKQIVKQAKGFDLVVMHQLDKSGLKEKFKMSSTEWLARNLACSVLLVQD